VVDLTARTGAARALRAIGVALTLLFAAGCLASLVAGPGSLLVRLVAGAVGLLIVLLVVAAGAAARRRPHRLLVDHLADGPGQEFPIGEAVQRVRPGLWRGHRSGSSLFGGHSAWLAHLAGRRERA